MTRRAYVAVMDGEEYSLGVAIEGERGYHPTTYSTVATYEEASAWAQSSNADLGWDADDVAEIVLSTF